MKRLSVLFFSCPMLLFAPATLAQEVPELLTLQGHLRTAGGQPYDGQVDIDVLLHNAPEGGTLLYSEPFLDASISGGRFALEVGAAGTFHTSATTLAELINLEQEIWASLTVDGGAELPRREVGSGFFAFRAARAAQVDCDACIDATQIANGSVTDQKLAGNSVFAGHIAPGAVGDEKLALGGVGLDKLAAQCVEGQIIRQQGGAWVCADHGLAAASGGLVSNEHDESGALAGSIQMDDQGTTVGSFSSTDNGTLLDVVVHATIAHPHPDTLTIELQYTPNGAAAPAANILLELDSVQCPTAAAPIDCSTPVAAPCLETSYSWPDPNPVSSGSLDELVGLDANGTWELVVIDGCETYPDPDPEGTQFLSAFSVDYRVFGGDGVHVAGDMTIDGNVGIGTTTPQAKLAINGGLHVGGDSNPGNDNLQVDGTANIGGGLTVGGPINLSGNALTNVDWAASGRPFAWATLVLESMSYRTSDGVNLSAGTPPGGAGTVVCTPNVTDARACVANIAGTHYEIGIVVPTEAAQISYGGGYTNAFCWPIALGDQEPIVTAAWDSGIAYASVDKAGNGMGHCVTGGPNTGSTREVVCIRTAGVDYASSTDYGIVCLK